MVVFRLLSATAGSATGPAAMAYVNRLFAPNERVRPLGLWSFVTAGAPVLGVVIGGPVISAIGWRMIFVVQAPLLLGAALLGSFSHKKTSVVVHKANKELGRINELIVAKKIVPVIDTVYPLVETAAAIQHVGEGRAKGKVVVRIAAPGS